MAKTAQELINDLKKANDDYHEIIGELLACEDFDIEQRVTIGAKALPIFEHMKRMNEMLNGFLS